MVRDVAYKNRGKSFSPDFVRCKTPSIVMPFPDHAMDQHVFLGATAMSYFESHYLRRRSPSLLKKLLDDAMYSAPFQRLLAHAFLKVSGYNPRRESSALHECSTFVKSVRYAQRHFCKMLHNLDGMRELQPVVRQTHERYDLSLIHI